MQILILEDDAEMANLIANYLAKHAMDSMCTPNPIEALKLLETHSFDAVVLDLELPQMDGLEFCRQVRQRFTLPILISSARGELSDKVLGLEMGADDYMAKPYEPRELVARLKALVRRFGGGMSPTKVGEFEIDERSMSIAREGKNLELSTAEYHLFKYLLHNRGKVLSREQILRDVEVLDYESANRSVDVHISKIRSKIGDDPKSPRVIKSVWGIGYQCIV